MLSLFKNFRGQERPNIIFLSSHKGTKSDTTKWLIFRLFTRYDFPRQHQNYGVRSDIDTAVFWQKSHLSYAKLNQFVICPRCCDPAHYLSCSSDGDGPRLITLLPCQKENMMLYVLYENNTSWLLKGVCGLINSIITLMENLSCVAMIAL